MTSFGKSTRVQLEKLIAQHKRYLETYKFLNNGSIEGATTFSEFYTYKTFTCRYSEYRIFTLLNSR